MFEKSLRRPIRYCVQALRLLIACLCLSACVQGFSTGSSPSAAPTTTLPAGTGIDIPAVTAMPRETFEATLRSAPTLSATPQPTRTARQSPLKTQTSAATASPTPLGCWEEGGSLELGSLPTDLLRLPLDYRLYLPACYDQQPERRYPVLYLIHGQSYTDDQWDRLGVDEAADTLVAGGETPPFIIVMPRDRYGGQPSENDFARVVVEELLPFIEENYRTIEERDYRAVGGLSRGGGWAVHLAITQWETFGALGAHSPAIFYDDAQRMRVYLDAIPPEKMPRIYIDIGDRDRPEIMRATLWFEELLNQRGIPHEWYLFSGYHAEDYWSDHLEAYLRWYSKPWR